ncbi:hypothetical protein MPER_04698 [Moniliophthora perniciosa FA553]|nr:hypothetical protein MPER_04698 [Moniliophthora perniciosa FA553]
MAASPAIPGLFLCFAATVLLIFASRQDAELRFGIFGFTGSDTSIGYTFNPALLGFEDDRLNNGIIHNLTRVLILHPIAARLAGLAVLFGLCGAGYHRAGTVLMTLLSGLAAIITLVGNANWLVLGALGALFLGFCSSACGIFGSYKKRRTY